MQMKRTNNIIFKKERIPKRKTSKGMKVKSCLIEEHKEKTNNSIDIGYLFRKRTKNDWKKKERNKQ